MTRQYFYDSTAGALIAFDPITNSLEIFPSLLTASHPAKPAELEEKAPAVQKKPGKQKSFTDEELFPTPKTKGNGCPECGSLRRHKTDCSRPTKVEHYPSGSRKPFKRPPCEECGSKGARHFKVCSKNGQENSRTGNEAWARLDGVGHRSPALSKQMFDRIKMSVKHDIPADVIARELKLTLMVVNAAIIAPSYEEYRV